MDTEDLSRCDRAPIYSGLNQRHRETDLGGLEGWANHEDVLVLRAVACGVG